MHNNRKYCTHSLFFSKKTISHSKTIETNLSLSLRNEPLIPINSDTLLRTYRSRYLSLPLTHTRLYPPTHALVPSLLRPTFSAPSYSFTPAFALFFTERATPCLCTFAYHPTQNRHHRWAPSPQSSSFFCLSELI